MVTWDDGSSGVYCNVAHLCFKMVACQQSSFDMCFAPALLGADAKYVSVPELKRINRISFMIGGVSVTGASTGVSYTLAVLVGSGGYHDVYTGHATEHEATGFTPGQSTTH